MRAERDGAGWRLTGEKTSISLGMAAHTAIVFARTSEDGARGISAFYVELDERYVQRSPFRDLGSKCDRPRGASLRRAARLGGGPHRR